MLKTKTGTLILNDMLKTIYPITMKSIFAMPKNADGSPVFGTMYIIE